MSTAHSMTGIEYRQVPGQLGVRAGSDGSVWSCWQMVRNPGEHAGFRAVESSTWRRLAIFQGTRDGYFTVTLKWDGKYRPVKVHRIILEAFAGKRPPGQECRHLDGNKANNSISNLKWGTPQENADDRERHGTQNHKSVNQGAKHGLAKLTDNDIREMLRLRGQGVRVREIARRFGVHWVHTYAILRGEKWRHVPRT